MVIALIVSLISVVIFARAWLKAKADVSFLEGKAADFLNREKRWVLEIEELKLMIAQGSALDITQANKEITLTYSPAHEELLFELMPKMVDKPFSNSDPKASIELQVAELGDASLAFLQKLGAITESSVLAAASISEHEEVEQVRWFDDRDLTVLMPPSLEKIGLHYWEGRVVQKYSDDLCLISNGTFQYHLSFSKFEQYLPGDRVCLQVMVSESGKNRDVIAAWSVEELDMPA